MHNPAGVVPLSAEITRSRMVPLPMKKNIRFVPTPDAVVEAMLSLANFGPDDVLYDLGCGDGRLVRAAARLGGRGVGIDIDESLLQRGREAAHSEGLSHLTEFRRENLFEANIQDATVVTLYLGYAINMALRPKLLSELSASTRLVSHSYDMEDWEAERHITVEAKWVYLWTVGSAPEHLARQDRERAPSVA
jgi:SAM-dependent methyltransferase